MLYRCLLWVCSMLAITAQSLMVRDCLKSAYVLNVVLLEDDVSEWSLKFVKAGVERAIAIENQRNAEEGLNFKLTANYCGFNTSSYRRRGCGSSTCEGVEILKRLQGQNEVGCAMLGPSCTYATFQLVDLENGFNSSVPIISAGSFGLSCDYKAYLTRLLPPARKISNLFIEFLRFEESSLKPRWEAVYVYKKPENSEDCFWYINALDAPSAAFNSAITRKVLRKPEELHSAFERKNRTSNLFIICGTPEDVANLTDNGRRLEPDIVILLIDLYNHEYHSAAGSPAMSNVLVITMPNIRNYTEGWTDNGTLPEMNDYVAGYHDGVHLFGLVLRQKMLYGEGSVEENASVENPFKNISFSGIGGQYVLDEHGDRDVNFSVMYMSTTDSQYKVLFEFDTSTNNTAVVDANPTWHWKSSRLPDDRPAQEQVLLATQDIIVIVLGISVVVVTVFALIFYRRNIKDRQAQKQWSHIPPDRITPVDDKDFSLVSLKIDEDQRKDSIDRIRRGRYDQKPIILKELKNTEGYFSEEKRIELNTLLRIDYYNLTKFYGTVKFEYGVFGVYEFCERGSLRYVLNDKISYPEETFMDLEFKISVMHDIVKGMSYLHLSNIAVHGRLKSTNCVVDSRMVVKITDFGCNNILRPSRDLWTAPEHLRNPGTSQKGDVYSFGIISQEILLRKCTFYTAACSDRAEKTYRVQFPDSCSFFRPDLNLESAGERERELCGLIKNCWDEDPEKRPDFKKIESCLVKISSLHSQGNESYMDSMIRRLQMYSRNLEHLVEERTALYKAERDRADQLNFMLLPGPVVQSLKERGYVEPELFDEVSIYFSDIVGFTTLCQYSTPMEVVNMLNEIYKNFDSILDNHDVYKVETIGDAYMVASGLPNRNGNRHAVDISRMALDILSFMGTFRLQHLQELPVWIRIGVHSGPCAAGVVGIKMPRYCLFGDTVNTASRMESTGLPLRIHVSQPTISILQRTDCQFVFERRGETYLKGRGTETTYWLTGVKGQEYNLPVPPTAENFQRQQQELAHMIESCLEKRSLGGGRKEQRKTLSTRQRRREKEDGQGDQQPEYLHLVDNLITHM
uniref:Guanylate cyclase n=1 Tax=Anguilla anguilla TaxID=7936 RepID=B8ZHI6_ANGAN|nr:guanylate cyclase C type 2 [Anguilla anguilla]